MTEFVTKSSATFVAYCYICYKNRTFERRRTSRDIVPRRTMGALNSISQRGTSWRRTLPDPEDQVNSLSNRGCAGHTRVGRRAGSDSGRAAGRVALTWVKCGTSAVTTNGGGR